MELKFLLCCQQTCRDLDADSRGKQNPRHERVKEHEPVAWDAESQTDGARCMVGQWEGGMEDGPFSPCFLHICHPASTPKICANGRTTLTVRDSFSGERSR